MSLQLAPVTLERGERFSKLTVLHPIHIRGGILYQCGCECGYHGRGARFRAAQLMKGKVKACRRCTSAANSYASLDRETP